MYSLVGTEAVEDRQPHWILGLDHPGDNKMRVRAPGSQALPRCLEFLDAFVAHDPSHKADYPRPRFDPQLPPQGLNQEGIAFSVEVLRIDAVDAA